MSTFPPTAGFINSLDPANPINADFVYGSDDWHRFIQQVLVNQFPNGNGGDGIGLDAAVNPTPDEFNTLEGINTGSTIESRLAALETYLDPVGRIVAWPLAESLLSQTLTGANAPGIGTWHWCDGSVLDGSTTYSALYAKILNQYGGTDAASMQIPKIQGQVIAGRGTGTVLTDYREGVDDSTQGNTGGEQAHIQATDELASHNHAAGGLKGRTNDQALDIGVTSIRKPTTGTGTYSQDISGNTADAGSSAAANVVQPTIILAFYIRVL